MAKSIADKTDFGSILLNSTEKDEQMLAPIIQELGCSMPNVKLSVYKNRRGSIVQSYIWMVADKSTCRFNPIFVTDWWYKPIEVEKTKIKVVLPWED